MSTVLYAVGALAILAGVVMIGFGIPVNAFSLGNTLISAGVTSIVGGLIILGLGAVVAQLGRLLEALAMRPPLRTARPLEPFEEAAHGGAPAGRIPFPSKPKAPVREQRPAEIRPETLHEVVPTQESFGMAPTLPNPEAQAAEHTEELPSPKQPQRMNGSGSQEKQPEPTFDAGWRAPPPMPPAAAPPSPPPQTFFDTMWPAPERRAKPSVEAKSETRQEARFESRFEPKPEFHPEPETEFTAEVMPQAEPEAPVEPTVPSMTPQAEPEAAAPPVSEKRAVAILKSGMVDGMGYTLYVDGSIEAELPQGTLHFASINELRSHLEKNS